MAGSGFDVTGRAVLVTGGNSGLGRGMALAFRDAGARVAIAARRADRNAAVLAELGDGAMACEMDVTDEASVEQVIAAVLGRFGRLDVLVNNAGTVNRASVMELERAAWDSVLAVNLTGAFLCTKHAARHMARQRAGKIVTSLRSTASTGRARGCRSPTRCPSTG